jgi:hypothetical protein
LISAVRRRDGGISVLEEPVHLWPWQPVLLQGPVLDLAGLRPLPGLALRQQGLQAQVRW